VTTIHCPLACALGWVDAVNVLEDIVLHLQETTPTRHASVRDGLGQSIDKCEHPVEMLHTWPHVGADKKVVGDFSSEIRLLDKMITPSKSILVDNVYTLLDSPAITGQIELTIGKGGVRVHDIQRLTVGHLSVVQERIQKGIHSLLNHRLQFAHSLS
jgi:hypothetical protein